MRDSGGAIDDDAVDGLLIYFGSMPRALLSLWMAISGGKDWSDFLEPLLLLGTAHVALFVVYVIFVILVVLNVVQGAFLDGALQVAQRDRDDKVQQKLADRENYAKHLEDLFHDADTDGSGTLAWEEFRDHCSSDHVKAYLSTLNLKVSDVSSLFRLLDTNGNGYVCISEFVSGCSRIKGEARSIDLCTLLYESRKTAMRIAGMEKHTMQRFTRLDEAVSLPKWRMPVKTIARMRTVSGQELPADIFGQISSGLLPSNSSGGSVCNLPGQA